MTSTKVIADICLLSYKEQLLMEPQGRVEIYEQLCYSLGLRNEHARQHRSKATRHRFMLGMCF